MIRFFTTVVIAAVIAFVAYVFYEVWKGTNITGVLKSPVEWVSKTTKTIRGEHKHDLAAEKPLPGELELAAVRIAKDALGEVSTELVEVMRENFDAMLRQRDLGVSFAQCFRKACLWTTLDWNHNKNVPFLNPWGWVDSDLERTRDDVPPDILKLAREIVIERHRQKADTNKCAIYVVRPMDHSTTRWSGELSARKVIKRLPQDPILKDKPFRTKYHCRPEDLAKLK
jgi:hypothetical protein